MQSIRSAHRLVRLVLALFVFALGVAVASPLIKPMSLDVVCSASGVFKIVNADDANGAGGKDSSAPGSHGLNCPLCLHLAAPAMQVHQPDFAGFTAPAEQTSALPAVPFASRSAAALPPRGPPIRL